MLHAPRLPSPWPPFSTYTSQSSPPPPLQADMIELFTDALDAKSPQSQPTSPQPPAPAATAVPATAAAYSSPLLPETADIDRGSVQATLVAQFFEAITRTVVPVAGDKGHEDVQAYDTSTFAFLFDLWSKQWLTSLYPAPCTRAGIQSLSSSLAEAEALRPSSTYTGPQEVPPATAATEASRAQRNQRPSSEALKQAELQCPGAVHLVIVRWYVLWMTSSDLRCRAVRQLLQRDRANVDVMLDIFRLTLAGHHGRTPSSVSAAAFPGRAYRHGQHHGHPGRASADATAKVLAETRPGLSTAAGGSGGPPSPALGTASGAHRQSASRSSDSLAGAAAALTSANGADGGDHYQRLPHQVLLVYKAWLAALKSQSIHGSALPRPASDDNTVFPSEERTRQQPADAAGAGSEADGTPAAALPSARADILSKLGAVCREVVHLSEIDTSFFRLPADQQRKLLQHICSSVSELFHVSAQGATFGGHDEVVSLVRDGLSIYQRICINFASLMDDTFRDSLLRVRLSSFPPVLPHCAVCCPHLTTRHF